MSVLTGGAEKALGIGLAMLCLKKGMRIVNSTGLKAGIQSITHFSSHEATGVHPSGHH